MTPYRMDWDREARTGTAEAVLCDGKTAEHIAAILSEAEGQNRRLLLTRLDPDVARSIARPTFDYDILSRTGMLGAPVDPLIPGVAVVTGGTSDLPVALESARTLNFHGYAGPVIADVGVAGLWRLLDRIDDIRSHRILIAVAGMEGALFSVLTGLVAAPVIAVPAPCGYGVGADGSAALTSALASCAAGLTVVNIGNGFGAACAAIRMLRAQSQHGIPEQLRG